MHFYPQGFSMHRIPCWSWNNSFIIFSIKTTTWFKAIPCNCRAAYGDTSPFFHRIILPAPLLCGDVFTIIMVETSPLVDPMLQLLGIWLTFACALLHPLISYVDHSCKCIVSGVQVVNITFTHFRNNIEFMGMVKRTHIFAKLQYSISLLFYWIRIYNLSQHKRKPAL